MSDLRPIEYIEDYEVRQKESFDQLVERLINEHCLPSKYDDDMDYS